MTLALGAFRFWTLRRYLFALAVAMFTALAVGIPSDLIDTPLFGRPVAITAWAYPVWIVTSILVGLLVAASVRARGQAAGGGVLTMFAVGCPVCNKPIVLALGASGALELWAPLQPVLGAVAIAFLAVALVIRLRGEVACKLSLTQAPRVAA
ncbi:MAG: hypothetical protein ACR2OD_03290 [Gaiellaceae bacterium]